MYIHFWCHDDSLHPAGAGADVEEPFLIALDDGELWHWVCSQRLISIGDIQPCNNFPSLIFLYCTCILPKHTQTDRFTATQHQMCGKFSLIQKCTYLSMAELRGVIIAVSNFDDDHTGGRKTVTIHICCFHSQLIHRLILLSRPFVLVTLFSYLIFNTIEFI